MSIKHELQVATIIIRFFCNIYSNKFRNGANELEECLEKTLLSIREQAFQEEKKTYALT